MLTLVYHFQFHNCAFVGLYVVILPLYCGSCSPSILPCSTSSTSTSLIKAVLHVHSLFTDKISKLRLFLVTVSPFLSPHLCAAPSTSWLLYFQALIKVLDLKNPLCLISNKQCHQDPVPIWLVKMSFTLVPTIIIIILLLLLLLLLLLTMHWYEEAGIPGSRCRHRKRAVTQCQKTCCRNQQGWSVGRLEMVSYGAAGNWTNGLRKVSRLWAVKTAASQHT